ncbi:hypothetical protein [Agromyces bracchium]|uniref:Uncharacterized protein n=1 Tax=Agromyces bracchium TaxID=88376 RepID=A0A6I3M9Y7_9MICO|nr:hypothetical protein [Agromyces bracchium]MTH70114.1 hypothetical protein [Agromyces bracchium]
MLFDIEGPIVRLGSLIEAGAAVPTWYLSEVPVTSHRFVSCMNDLVIRMRTPFIPGPITI